MSGGYTDMLVSKTTKERLKKFADSKGIHIAQLLEHICDMLELQQAKARGVSVDTEKMNQVAAQLKEENKDGS